MNVRDIIVECCVVVGVVWFFVLAILLLTYTALHMIDDIVIQLIAVIEIIKEAKE